MEQKLRQTCAPPHGAFVPRFSLNTAKAVVLTALCRIWRKQRDNSYLFFLFISSFVLIPFFSSLLFLSPRQVCLSANLRTPTRSVRPPFFPKYGKSGRFDRFMPYLAEAEGFEPPWACAQTVFKTASL